MCTYHFDLAIYLIFTFTLNVDVNLHELRPYILYICGGIQGRKVLNVPKPNFVSTISLHRPFTQITLLDCNINHVFSL